MNTFTVANEAQTAVEMDVRMPVKRGLNDLPLNVPAVEAALARARAYASELVAARAVLDSTKTPTSAIDKTKNTKAKKIVDRNLALLDDQLASLRAAYVQSNTPPSRPPSPSAPTVQPAASTATSAQTGPSTVDAGSKRPAEPLVGEEPSAKKVRSEEDAMTGILEQQPANSAAPSAPPGLTRPPSPSPSIALDDIPSGYDTPRALTPAEAIPSGYDTPNASADRSNPPAASNNVPAPNDTTSNITSAINGLTITPTGSSSTTVHSPTSSVAASSPDNSTSNPPPPSASALCDGKSQAPFAVADSPNSATARPKPRKVNPSSSADDEVEIVEVAGGQKGKQSGLGVESTGDTLRREVHDIENDVIVMEEAQALVPKAKAKKAKVKANSNAKGQEKEQEDGEEVQKGDGEEKGKGSKGKGIATGDKEREEGEKEQGDGEEKGKKKGKGTATGSKKKYVHMGDTWDALTDKQKQKVLEIISIDKVRYEKFDLPPSDVTRCWTLREASLNADLVLSSEKYATSCFIKSTGRTVCHLHAVTKLKVYDRYVDTDARFSVTGVPFPPSFVAKKRKMDSLEPETVKRAKVGQQRKQRNPLAPNTRFTLDRVLKYFPTDPTNKFHIMHCGCILEHALFDLYKFKGLAVESASTKKSEQYGRMAKTRDRLADFTLFTRFGLSVADLFTHDIDGSELTEMDRLQRVVDRLNTKLDAMYRDEYDATRRDLERQVKEAEMKMKARMLTYVEVDTDDEGRYRAGPSTITRRPTKPAPRRRDPCELFTDDSDSDSDSDSGKVAAQSEDDGLYGDEDAEGDTDTDAAIPGDDD